MLILYFSFFASILMSSLSPAAVPCEGSSTLMRIKSDYSRLEDLQIHNCHARHFETSVGKVDFIIIQYGQSNDCMSGCFYSHACFIVDEKGTYPYSFAFYGDLTKNGHKITGNTEAIIKLPSGQNSPHAEICTDSRNCKSRLSGLSHSLIQDRDFVKFRQNNILKGGYRSNSSPFRWCMY